MEKGAPVNVYSRGLDAFARRLATPEMITRVSLVFGVLMSIVALLLTLAILVMLPLKQKVPYFVETRASGEVVPSNRVAAEFTPDEKNIAYFIWTRFAMPLFTVDEQTKARLESITPILRGAAVQQLNDYLRSTEIVKKMIEDPAWRQEVKPASNVDFFKTSNVAGTAVLWLSIKSAGGKNPGESKIRLSVDYVILPVKEDAEIFNNPIGLYITGFRIDNIYAQ